MLLLAMALATSLTSTPRVHEIRPKTDLQRTVLRAREREVCVSARKFVGKSWLAWVGALVYGTDFPGSRSLVCREERVSMNNTTLPVLWDVLPADWRRYWRPSLSQLHLPNGSEIHVYGLDEPSRMQGSRYGYAACDQAEDLSESQFDILDGCVGQHQTIYGEPLPYNQLVLFFNPSHTEHWAYKRYQPDLGDGIRMVGRKGEVKARVCHAHPDDLKDIMPENYRISLENKTGVFYRRMVLGEWCSAEGLIYDLWRSGVHTVDRETIDRRYPADAWSAWGGYPPPQWPRWFGIDFGYEPDPFAAGWWAEAPERTRYLYRQLCHTRRTIEEQAAQVLALEAEELAALRECCPPARRQELAPYLASLNVCRWSDHHRGERAMLAQRGIATSPADKEVLAGIQTVLGLLKEPTAEEAERSGRSWPLLQVVRGSLAEVDPILREQRRPTCLEEEIGGYIWRSTREGSMGGASRQLPRQLNDHALDAMRYVHHSLARGRAGVWV